MVGNILANNLDIVFLVYGLAFFIIGVAIFIQPHRESSFRFFQISRFLGWFGIAHGLNEWLDMLVISRGIDSEIFNGIRLAVLTLSFVFIFEFGRELLNLSYRKSLPRQVTVIFGLLTVLAMIFFSAEKSIWPRYFLAFPGCIMAAVGFWGYSRYIKDAAGRHNFEKYFSASAVAVFLYGVLSGLVVSPAAIYPAALVNTVSFQNMFGIPVQAFRCVCAVVIAFCIWKILGLFHWEICSTLEAGIENANSAYRIKSKFLEKMVKEMKIPLDNVVGFSQLLLTSDHGNLNLKQKEYLEYILENATHQLYFIKDIYDMSQIEAGNLRLEMWIFNVKKLVDQAVSQIKEKTSKHNIAISSQVDDDVDSIFADECRVRQILMNLLSNAVKFTRDGGKILISVKKQAGELVFAIQDTGIGIRAENKSKIFEVFEKSKVGYVRQYETTGLGLYLAKTLVMMHEGRIWAESDGENKGTTFYFTLPFK